jgi:hypothetical protein
MAIKKNTPSNPVIILGAGASYDYSPHVKISPLTKDLVDPKYLQVPFFEKYQEAADLFSSISHDVLSGRKTFEVALQELRDSVGNSAHRRAQFVALEFYLQALFNDISSHSHPINNYSALVGAIRDFNDGYATVVSLNYDTLFEKSVGSNIYKTMSDYTTRNIQLIKLHGSHDWAFITDRNSIEYQLGDHKDDYNFYKANPDYTSRLRKKNAYPYHINEIEQAQKGRAPIGRLPAIAIPLSSKLEFLCPPPHLAVLESTLQRTDRILIIGWKAADPALLELIQRNVEGDTTIYVVSSGKKSAENITQSLQGSRVFNFRPMTTGFSGFVNSEHIKEFFTMITARTAVTTKFL